MKKALMVVAVMMISAVLWGEEPPAPQTTESPKEEASPAQKEEPATHPIKTVEEKSEKTISVTEKNGEEIEQKKVTPEEEKAFVEEFFSTDERKKKDEKDKKMGFSADFSFDWVSGNASSFVDDAISVGLSVSTKWDDNITKVLVSHRQKYFPIASPDSELTKDGFMTNASMAAKGDLKLGVDHYIANRWELFFYADTERNPQQLFLNLRFGTGAGAKFVFFRNRYWVFDLGAAPVFELTSYVGQKQLREFRSSWRARMDFTLYGFINVGGKVFYVPDMLDFPDDYRYKIDFHLNFYYFLDQEKTQSIAIGFNYLRDYNSRPNADPVIASQKKTIQKLDQTLETTIGVNF